MDLRALRYFIEVVRQNGFTRAAETLHVTQPTISKMVKALEDEFGGPLLLREGRGVQLTDAGQVVYDQGMAILEQAQLLRRQVAEVDNITRGELSVGIMPTTGHYMAPVIALFQQRYPGVNLQVNEQGARAQYQLIQDGKLDMALGLFSEPDPALERSARPALCALHQRLCAARTCAAAMRGRRLLTQGQAAKPLLGLYRPVGRRRCGCGGDVRACHRTLRPRTCG